MRESLSDESEYRPEGKAALIGVSSADESASASPSCNNDLLSLTGRGVEGDRPLNSFFATPRARTDRRTRVFFVEVGFLDEGGEVLLLDEGDIVPV